MMKFARKCTVWLTLSAIAYGCGGKGGVVKTTNVPATARPVAQEATQEQLLERYNAIARGVQSVDATAELRPSAGSAYSGVISEYHEVKAFVLAARPYNIRMIGEVPVIGKTVFDMASDGTDFEVSIPSRGKFLVGAISLSRPSAKPIENLRPQHLIDALLWPEVRKEEAVFLEESNDESGRYYVLNVLRGGYQTEILRKVWFDRTDLHVVRLESFGPKGTLVSDVRYGNWQALPTAVAGIAEYPMSIRLDRTRDEYRLEMTVTKVSLNESMEADRFKLKAPAGAEVVHLADATEEKKP